MGKSTTISTSVCPNRLDSSMQPTTEPEWTNLFSCRAMRSREDFAEGSFAESSRMDNKRIDFLLGIWRNEGHVWSNEHECGRNKMLAQLSHSSTKNAKWTSVLNCALWATGCATRWVVHEYRPCMDTTTNTYSTSQCRAIILTLYRHKQVGGDLARMLDGVFKCQPRTNTSPGQHTANS
jgi:hypothetical protein